jgi:hypothetical protein
MLHVPDEEEPAPRALSPYKQGTPSSTRRYLVSRVAPRQETNIRNVRFEVFTAVTMKNGVFWDVTPCGCCKNRRFGVT